MQINMNAYDNLSSNSFKSICRTCLMHGDLFIIDEISWEGMDFSFKLCFRDVITYCCLQFEPDDRLPNQMCLNCIRTMCETYQFLCKCRDSESVLKKILLSESMKSENVDNSEANLEPVVTELEIKDEIDCDYGEINDDITDVKDIVKQPKDELALERDNDINVDDPVEVESKLFDIEDRVIESSSHTDVKDIVEESKDADTLEGDNDVDGDNPVEIDKKPFNADDTDTNLLDKTDTVKEQIIDEIRVKNKLRLRQLAKAQMMQYNYLSTKKSQYIFRKGPPNVCTICNASFRTHKELNRHQNEARHKKYYKCAYCGKMLNIYYKDEHIRTHTGEKPHKCPTCGKGFNSNSDVKRHMVKHMEVKPYVCRFCGKGFTRTQYVREHERIHTGEQLLCPFCGKGFHSYATLSVHEKTHRGPSGTSLTNDKTYSCHLCDKVLMTEYTLNAHILLHGPKNFSCEICGKAYISENKLQAHIKVTHQDKKYSCHLCKKEYKQKTTLDDHLKLHSGKNYPCNECGKKFACRGSLTQHKRKHTGDPTYQCKVCSHISVNKRDLENHLRTHTGEKPFVCAYCGKCFAHKANITAHTRIHTNEKNHVCTLCDKAFTNSTGLKRHMTVHEKRGKDGNIV